jgi:hypothetical protein
MQSAKTSSGVSELEKHIRQNISTEILRATKIPDNRLFRSLINPLVRKPVNHFSSLIADFDSSVKENGFVIASNQLLQKLTREVAADGQEFIPVEGPLIIASNHPGAYDGFAIISKLPRNDFRLMVSGIPFFENLPNASKNLIFVTHDTTDRMEVIRKSIHHLINGGSLLIFPSGRLDPDPSIFPDAAEGLKRWSRSVNLFLNKVPSAKLVLTIASGVISKNYLNDPFIKMFKDDHEKRRMLEFLQVISQMRTEKPAELFPKVSFAKPLDKFSEINGAERISETYITEKAMQLLLHHKRLYYQN